MGENERKEHSIMEAFKETALALAPAWRELFFTLHRCPELGRREHRTAKLIRERLEALGIPYMPLADKIGRAHV